MRPPSAWRRNWTAFRRQPRPLSRSLIAAPGAGQAGPDPARLGDALLRTLPPPQGEVRSSSAATILLCGKYATASAIKFRSFLLLDGLPATIKVWGRAVHKRKLGIRERQVREAMRAGDRYPAPEVLGSGEVTGHDYLVERVVYGTHPRGNQEREEAAVEVMHRMLMACRAHGIEHRPLPLVVRPEFTALDAVLADPSLHWSAHAEQRRLLTEHVATLVGKDLTLPCALGHGDLRMGNVLRDESGEHLAVDWEEGGVRPIAFDLRKLLLSSNAWERVQQRGREALRPLDGDGARSYRWRDQLLLATCNELALTPVRRERGRRAGTLEQFDASLLDTLAAAVGALRP